MARFNKPTEKQIADLVGGKPLDFAFNSETGALCVIAPTGQKFRFTPEDWEKSEKEKKPENNDTKDESNSTPKPIKSSKSKKKS